MRFYKLILAAVIGMLATQASATDKGVSRQLAEHRAAHVSNIRYEISFNVLKSDESGILFTDIVRFNWNGTDDLELDFQGQLDSIYRVNGEQYRVNYANEHVIVPKHLLHKGHNEVYLSGKTLNEFMNRRNDFLYTLFVPDHARSAFPCFDQPDLKAQFDLRLILPTQWRAIANAPLEELDTLNLKGQEMAIWKYKTTKPLPTYLFSFAAGMFKSLKSDVDGREIEVLYRETDPDKTAQLGTIIQQAASSLSWLEQYTNIKYPFQKYGLVIIPGYQFGGMEHPGCIQLNANTVFLGKEPTPDEQLNRFNLIAHETAHMWFGDLVTMKWFDDVWTKEVFANFMADKMTRQQFPDFNHDLLFLKAHYPAAYSTDRTQGTHPISQQLDNLNKAGLLYDNIIYHKAPIMMQKLEERMGEKQMQQALRTYLWNYSYRNATWDDLIDIMHGRAPKAQLKTFSKVWVKEKGMPTFSLTNNWQNINITQEDPWYRQLHWQQQVRTGLYAIENMQNLIYEDTLIDMTTGRHTMHMHYIPDVIVPNTDGKAYGYFKLKDTSQAQDLLLASRQAEADPQQKFSIFTTIYENYLQQHWPAQAVFGMLSKEIANTTDPLVASTLCQYVCRIAGDTNGTARSDSEEMLYSQSLTHPLPAIRLQLKRWLATNVRSSRLTRKVYDIWQAHDDPTLSERDYMAMAYHLALVMPDQWQYIIRTQRDLLTNDDRRREFDYVSRGCNPSAEEQQKLFLSLLQPEGRTAEPWAITLLSLLTDESRQSQRDSYITIGLDNLEHIRQTSGIFFPTNWLFALFNNNHSTTAKLRLSQWIQAQQGYEPTLMNRVKEAAFRMMKD